MSFNAASLRLMAEKGLSALDIAEIAEAAEGPRSSAAERQARYRLRKKAGDVTRDVTALCDMVSLKEDQNPSGTNLTDEADASSPVRQPVAEAVAHWNEVAPQVGWPTVKTISANRSKLTAARLREHGLDGWKAAIARARASPYLAGADPPSWFTFPWLIKSENFLKVTEGNYDRNRSDRRQPSGWETAYHANVGGFGSG